MIPPNQGTVSPSFDSECLQSGPQIGQTSAARVPRVDVDPGSLWDGDLGRVVKLIAEIKPAAYISVVHQKQ